MGFCNKIGAEQHFQKIHEAHFFLFSYKTGGDAFFYEGQRCVADSEDFGPDSTPEKNPMRILLYLKFYTFCSKWSIR
jgi:hypothetical protein